MAKDLKLAKTILPANGPYKRVALNTSTPVLVLEKNTRRLGALLSLDPEGTGVAVFGSDNLITASLWGAKILNLDTVCIEGEAYQDEVWGLAVTAATDVFVWETWAQS